MLRLLGLGIASFVISICFALYYGIRGRKLIGAGICGFIGYVCYEAISMIQHGYHFESYFVASCVIVIAAEIFARWLQAPVTVFLVPALLPIVPGAALYNMMLSFMQGENLEATESGASALVAASAIVCGILAVSTFMKLIPRKRNTKKSDVSK